jgi:hypothetical protein
MTFAEAKGNPKVSRELKASRPLLMVDIDGVISLFGLPGLGPGPGLAPPPTPGKAPEGAVSEELPAGSFQWIDGMPHFLSATAAAHLLELSSLFDLVWASGWEERANEHLPHLLGLPPELPYVRFPERAGGKRGANAHWKLEAIDAHARDRALAWIDDTFNAACEEWAAARAEPTLLVGTAPDRGLTAREAEQLSSWARALQTGDSPRARPSS